MEKSDKVKDLDIPTTKKKKLLEKDEPTGCKSLAQIQVQKAHIKGNEFSLYKNDM